MQLQELRYVIEHVDGDDNLWADMLSRWGCMYQPNTPVKRALRQQRPDRLEGLRYPDRDVGDDLLIPEDHECPKMDTLLAAQRQHRRERPNGLTRGDDGLYRNQTGQVWIPTDAQELKKSLFAVAHQGQAGHRGAKATEAALKEKFFWTTMKDDCAKWRGACLQCIKLSDGAKVLRPFRRTDSTRTAGRGYHGGLCLYWTKREWSDLHLGDG